MPTFSIENFGCRATDADAAAIRDSLARRGFSLAARHDQADVVVLNSCTVTASADAQSREAIRKIHRANPSARIIVTGCYAQRAPDELAVIPGVAAVVGNAHQSEIAELAAEVGSSSSPALVSIATLETGSMSLERGPAKILTSDIFRQADLSFAAAGPPAGDRTRPILKIQDGCNNRCSYCVIPYVRGGSRSLAPGSVVEEAGRHVAAGAQEIVLSGINLGSYGRDLTPRTSLAEIAVRILAETEIERLRFSSIEPQDVTEDFSSLVAANPRIAPHFHVPLQSGSDRILRAMHRRYRAAHYAERIRRLHGLLPDAAIGADVIAGFPGETPADFQATADLVERLPFSYLHVFSFSARPGTKAEGMQGAVPAAEIHERARFLRALSEKKAAAFRRSQQGRILRALALHRRGEGWTEALTGNYLRVRAAGEFPANTWITLKVTPTLEERAGEARIHEAAARPAMPPETALSTYS
ncbi:MAG TPA: tRNA (N(6)-L-threonylcarbamoyladenosine(37)-C(2))-methylthiotransferase MtaB [Verrucomicrobiae bacterium]|nr:tRNA (N(6)-L-threonylcarbamoyladenosine(37)-C(2))-methylthiotransferase MtaB [Verrucomicrobiae bacterium]